MTAPVIVVTSAPPVTITGDNPQLSTVVAVQTAPAAYSSLTGLPTLGTASGLNVGTGPNQIVELDNSSRLPAVDGSQLSGLVKSIASNTGAFTLGIGLTNQVNDLRVSLATASNFLAADVLLNNTATFFDGPSMAQGTSGTWLVFGTVTLTDTGAAAGMLVKLWDGTTVIASTRVFVTTANAIVSATLGGIISGPAGNIRISCEDLSTTTGKILFNITGSGKDSSIFGIRIG